jgi:hypothetical protein
MKRICGFNMLDEREKEGSPAQRDNRVMFHMRLSPNKDDEAPLRP